MPRSAAHHGALSFLQRLPGARGPASAVATRPSAPAERGPIRKRALADGERQIFLALASVLLGFPAPVRVAEQADTALALAPPGMRMIFRLGLVAFDRGTIFFRHDGGLQPFSGLAWPAKCRYARSWMTHPNALCRQLFRLLRAVVLAAYYDGRPAAARLDRAREHRC